MYRPSMAWGWWCSAALETIGLAMVVPEGLERCDSKLHSNKSNTKHIKPLAAQEVVLSGGLC